MPSRQGRTPKAKIPIAQRWNSEHTFVIGLADNKDCGTCHRDKPKQHSKSCAKTICPQRHRPENAAECYKSTIKKRTESSAETTTARSLWASGSHVCIGARPILYHSDKEEYECGLTHGIFSCDALAIRSPRSSGIVPPESDAAIVRRITKSQ